MDELKYIRSLKYADFDPCTLSVQGYSDEFKNKLELFPNLLEIFFKNYLNIPKYSLINFMHLIWVSENLDKVIPYLDTLKEMIELDNLSICDSALNLIDHLSCEDNINIDLSFLCYLNIKYKYLKDYALNIYNHI